MPRDDWKLLKYTSLGFSTFVTTVLLIGGGFYAGRWADTRFGSDPVFLVVGTLLGLALAVASFALEVRALFGTPRGGSAKRR